MSHRIIAPIAFGLLAFGCAGTGPNRSGLETVSSQTPISHPAQTRANALAQDNSREVAAVQSENSECDEILAKAPKASPIPQIFSVLKNSKLKRDEFETTDAHKARVSESIEAIAQKLGLPRGFLVFTFKVDPMDVQYDADSRVLTLSSLRYTGIIGLRTERLGASSRDYYRVARIATQQLESDTYIGSNAFGVTRVVKRELRNEYSVAFDKGTSRYSGLVALHRGYDSLIGCG